MPTYFVRYEDLLTDPHATLTALFEFLLSRETIEKLNISDRIRTVIEQEQQVYKPRSGKVNANLSFFSPAQLQLVAETCKHSLKRFGYSSLLENGALESMPEVLKFNRAMVKCTVKSVSLTDYL